MRLIDADSLIWALHKTRQKYTGSSLEDSLGRCACDGAINVLVGAEPVELAPAVHAEWLGLNRFGQFMTCSACKRTVEKHTYEFCPHCGAKMHNP